MAPGETPEVRLPTLGKRPGPHSSAWKFPCLSPYEAGIVAATLRRIAPVLHFIHAGAMNKIVNLVLSSVLFVLCASAAEKNSQLERDKLPVPADGKIPIAFMLGPDAEVVDFSGPWGVFEYVQLEGRDGSPFQPYTVAATRNPLKVSAGLTIVPDYTFENAPAPRVIVVPAMAKIDDPPMLAWLQKWAPKSDLTLSVCNGAFILGKAGLLSGKTATAHHGALGMLGVEFPDVTVRRGARFVDAGKISTAGGLTSGIDLALHVVERYFGRTVAEQTAGNLEYQGQGWKDPDSNRAFAKRPVSSPGHPICPVCESALGPNAKIRETYKGQEILFCSESCKKHFDQNPARFFSP